MAAHLTVVDEWTRDWLAIDVAGTICSHPVLETRGSTGLRATRQAMKNGTDERFNARFVTSA